jgi:hypothetical protein
VSYAECREGTEYLYYIAVDCNEFRVPKRADWNALRACIDDAERRAKIDEAAYGFCLHCKAKVVRRERRPRGNDTCANGHVYPSAASVKGRAKRG